MAPEFNHATQLIVLQSWNKLKLINDYEDRAGSLIVER